MKIAARQLPLSRCDWLVFDYLDGLYRMSYYRPVRSRREQGKLIPRARAESIKPGSINTDKLKPSTNFVRFAVKRSHLRDALQVVLGEGDAVHDPDTIEAYIRATRWGAELP